MDYRVNPEVVLEKLNSTHAQELYDLTQSNRKYLKEWLPWLDFINDVGDTAKFIDSISDNNPAFAVMYGGAIGGVVSFNEINKQHRIGVVGYWLAQDFTGKGVITKAVGNLIEIGFKELKLNRIEIRCADGNVKSRAIPERLGFTYEATLRQCEWLYSKYVDHAIYSMLSSEYNA